MGINTYPQASTSSAYMGALGGTITLGGGSQVSDYITWDLGTPFAPNATYTITFAGIAGLHGVNSSTYKVALLDASGNSVATASGTNISVSSMLATFSVQLTPTQSFTKVVLGGGAGTMVYSTSSTAVTIVSGARVITPTTIRTWTARAASGQPSNIGTVAPATCFSSGYNFGVAQSSNTIYSIWNAGGNTTNAGGSLPFYSWDAATNTWSLRPSPSITGTYPGSAYYPQITSSGTKIYLYVGETWTTTWTLYTGAMQIYDTVTNTWSSGANQPIGGNCAYGDIGGGVLAAVGFYGLATGNQSYSATRLYNISSNTWSSGATVPNGPQGALNSPGYSYHADSVNGKLHWQYYAQGSAYSIYDRASNTWGTSVNVNSVFMYMKGSTGGNASSFDPVNFDSVNNQVWTINDTTNAQFNLPTQAVNVFNNVASSYSTAMAPVRRYSISGIGYGDYYYNRMFFGTGALANKVWQIYQANANQYQIWELDRSALSSYPAYLA